MEGSLNGGGLFAEVKKINGISYWDITKWSSKRGVGWFKFLIHVQVSTVLVDQSMINLLFGLESHGIQLRTISYDIVLATLYIHISDLQSVI